VHRKSTTSTIHAAGLVDADGSSLAEAAAVRAPAAHGRLAAPASAVGGELGAGEEEAAAGVV
jgi:hypothetical protein